MLQSSGSGWEGGSGLGKRAGGDSPSRRREKVLPPSQAAWSGNLQEQPARIWEGIFWTASSAFRKTVKIRF
ncbi:hypothetical protein CEF21_17205 [Bacillus sp. FJAT-42376]|nr:hypothetical protein CEF21_17205 [Bacillus sp. FJAT-42376]